MAASYEDLQDDIDRVARKVASDYPDMDWEDVRQELALFVITNGKSIKLRHEGGNPRWLLTRVAQTYCKDQRTQHLTLSPQYAYKPSDVKEILEHAFTAEVITEIKDFDDGREDLMGFDLITVASDVRNAYEKLKPELKVAIFKRYALKEIPERDSYDRKRLTQAIKELTHKLNTYKGGSFNGYGRRAISNAGARARISEVYEGY
jgi:DNA-directed RNA polymerase specialized sigma24 family protein